MFQTRLVISIFNEHMYYVDSTTAVTIGLCFISNGHSKNLNKLLECSHSITSLESFHNRDTITFIKDFFHLNIAVVAPNMSAVST